MRSFTVASDGPKFSFRSKIYECPTADHVWSPDPGEFGLRTKGSVPSVVRSGHRLLLNERSQVPCSAKIHILQAVSSD